MSVNDLAILFPHIGIGREWCFQRNEVTEENALFRAEFRAKQEVGSLWNGVSNMFGNNMVIRDTFRNG
jgi:hypothetical protein